MTEIKSNNQKIMKKQNHSSAGCKLFGCLARFSKYILRVIFWSIVVAALAFGIALLYTEGEEQKKPNVYLKDIMTSEISIDKDDASNSHVIDHPADNNNEEKSISEVSTTEADYNKDALDNYLNYLKNGNQLIIKFYNGENFEQELLIFSNHPLPKNIKEATTILSQYQAFKQAPTKSTEEDNIIKSKFINSIVKVKKLEKTKNDNLKSTTIENLNIINEYLYSNELKEDFLENQISPNSNE